MRIIRNGFTRAQAIGNVAALYLVALVIWLLIAGNISTPQGGSRITLCMNNVRSIAGALNNYLAAYGQYPIPAPQFRGDCWLASLYWTGCLSDKRILTCPTTDDNARRLQKPKFPLNQKDSCPLVSPAEFGEIGYPISQADFARVDTIPTDAISYCGRTNMSGLSAERTPSEQFTEKGLTGSPVVCDAPYNHSDVVNAAYIDQHVEPIMGGGEYVGYASASLRGATDLQSSLVAMDSGDDEPRMPAGWVRPPRTPSLMEKIGEIRNDPITIGVLGITLVAFVIGVIVLVLPQPKSESSGRDQSRDKN